MKRRAVIVAAVAVVANIPACSLLLADDLASGPRVIVVRDDAETQPLDAALDPDGVHEADAPVADESLVGWWSFDQVTAQEVQDLSGHDHTAVLVGDAVIRQDGAHAGGAMFVFGNGSAMVPSLAGPAFPRTGTLSIWFRWEAMIADDHLGIVDFFDPARRHVFLRHPNGGEVGTFQFALQDIGDGTPYAFATKISVPAKTWGHAVLVWDDEAQQARCHFDGTLVSSAPYSRPFSPADQLFQLGLGLEGAIDEVRLYSRGLTADEASLVP